MQFDRLKEAFAALVRGSVPRLDYYATYFGRVSRWDTTRQQVDVAPDDARLPTMQGVPLRGPAGVQWSIDEFTSTSVLIGWENADPSRPFAIGFSTGAHVIEATWNADQLFLGSKVGAQPPPLGESLNAALSTLAGALAVYVPIIQPIADPSGTASATLLSAIAAFQAALPGSLALRVKVA